MVKYYLERNRIEESPKGRYKYEYKVCCRVCSKVYWTRSYPSKQPPRCHSCAGTQTYTPSKIERENIRNRGDGYITKQGYHLIYDGEKYVPAHRYPFPKLPSNMVVHHIDGDKLNNELSNLIPLSKENHRKAHGSLEKCSYVMIQSGLVEYNISSNTYNLSSPMMKILELISVNSGNPVTVGADGNPEPSPYLWGRCNDYPVEEYIRSLMEARNTQTCCGVGDDIVSSA